MMAKLKFTGWSGRLLMALMMEAASTSETLINFYQTTRRYNPEYSHLHTRRRENLKSYWRDLVSLLSTLATRATHADDD
jgi:hypothetical protein